MSKARTPAQQIAARYWHTGRPPKIVPRQPTVSWWIDPASFYDTARQQYPRITAVTTSYQVKSYE